MSEKKVLVIDDEDFIRELVKDFLEMDGVRCDAADDVYSALEIVAREKYRLILLDRNLGETKAEDVIVRIREHDKDVPIVILTGDPLCGEDYLREIGASGIIFKPFQVTDFMKSVNKFLEN
jgi:two-component system alkaline phosphatase synthesis response regulator PhoP